MIQKFSQAKVGQKVWSILRGWGKIIDIDLEKGYPLCVEWPKSNCDWYAFDGRLYENDERPELYWNECEVKTGKVKVQKEVNAFASVYKVETDISWLKTSDGKYCVIINKDEKAALTYRGDKCLTTVPVKIIFEMEEEE